MTVYCVNEERIIVVLIFEECGKRLILLIRHLQKLLAGLNKSQFLLKLDLLCGWQILLVGVYAGTYTCP